MNSAGTEDTCDKVEKNHACGSCGCPNTDVRDNESSIQKVVDTEGDCRTVTASLVIEVFGKGVDDRTDTLADLR